MSYELPNYTFGVEFELINLDQTGATEALIRAGLPVPGGTDDLEDENGPNVCQCADCRRVRQERRRVAELRAAAGVTMASGPPWNPKYDCSIESHEDDETSHDLEVTSPILRGEEGMIALWLAADAFANAGALANDSCGMHVHIGANTFSPKQIKRIFLRYADLESKIDRLVAPCRRASRSTYTRSVNNPTYLERVRRAPDSREELAYCNHERYLKVNLMPLTSYGTIEVRHHNGCKDPDTVYHWVRFLLGFFAESARLEEQGIVENGSIWDGIDPETVAWWRQRLADRNTHARYPLKPGLRNRRTEWFRRWA